jgi:low temperature requirement protein LtrA
VLVASLWWSYFDREDRRAADKLVAAEAEERSRMASSATDTRTSRGSRASC